MWPLERKQQHILLAVAAMLLLVIGYKYASMQHSGDITPTPGLVGEGNAGMVSAALENQQSDSTQQSPVSQELVVHVAGAVQKAGVYRLPAGARVVDALEMAGAAADAALDYLNLAAPLQDGSQIYVYSLEQISQPQNGVIPAPGAVAAPGLGTANVSGLININTASQSELEQLPGIGPSFAQRIIDHRDQNGSFTAIEDIMQVSGIGNKRFEQLKGKICVH